MEFKEIDIGKVLHRGTTLKELKNHFIYIPILDSLQQMLSNDRIAKMVLKNPAYSEIGFYYDICDGRLFKTDELFKDKPDSLQLILYHDALEVCNPMGSNAGTEKLVMFYYYLGNLNPKVRSRHCAVRLLAIVNANIVKQYGYNAVLEPIITDIKKLENGHEFLVKGQKKTVYGKVISCTGDNEGQHEWGGFKGGVGFAFQKCRHCLCQFKPMQQCFSEEDFVLRSKKGHERHCRDVECAITDEQRNDFKVSSESLFLYK